MPKQKSLADAGISATSLDRRVAPCTDFYRFACGGWMARARLPVGRQYRDRVTELTSRVAATRTKILSTSRAAPPADKRLGRLGAFYRGCLDQATIQKAGIKPIEPLLQAARKARSRAGAIAALATLHRHGVWAGFQLAAGPEPGSSGKAVLYLAPAPLGLEQRDAYLRPSPTLSRLRRDYRALLTRVFELLGHKRARAAAHARAVLAIETALARVTPLPSERRDVLRRFHIMDRATLDRTVPDLPWSRYLGELGRADLARLNLTAPRYLRRFGKFVSTGSNKLAPYFEWQVARSMGVHLFRELRQELAKLDALRGATESGDRCARAVAEVMPEELGSALAPQLLDRDGRARARRLIEAIARGHAANLGEARWMSAKARGVARAELAAARFRVGYPDQRLRAEYSINPSDHAGNVLRARLARTKAELARVGSSDAAPWILGVDEVQILHNWLANRWTIPAAVLQPPLFGRSHSAAVNLGGLALAVGNEITHAIDASGSQLDASGRARTWWSAADRQRFNTRARCLVRQFGSYEVAPGSKVDGNQTLRENIADLAGVRAAYRAHRASLAADPGSSPAAGGFSADQQFFIAAAQAWCTRSTAKGARARAVFDAHAPARHRVNGTLRNVPELAAAFGCKANAPMNPAKRCSVF